MRVLVAGATSVPGIPLLRELKSRGHEVIGMTRLSSRTCEIESVGAKAVVADVFDSAETDKVVTDIGPEVVVSLLTTLPKWGPKRPKDFEPARRLWSTGVSNLVGAAQRARVRRIVAESVLFAYGYPTSGPAWGGRVGPVPGPAAQGWRRHACGAAWHGADSADVRCVQRHRGNSVALRRFLRSARAA